MPDLPPPPQPLGAYLRAVRSGRLMFLSGMLPLRDGRPAYVGSIGGDLSAEDARASVRLAAMNSLAALHAELGGLDRIVRVVRLAIYLQTVPGFTAHASIADAASELVRDFLGDRAGHARLVFGVLSLPAAMPVELEWIVETA